MPGSGATSPAASSPTTPTWPKLDISRFTDVSACRWVEGCPMRGHLRTSGPQVPCTLDSLRGGNAVTAPNWHDELELMAEMSSVNNQIARFVLRLLDADAGHAEQVSVSDEGILGVRLVDLGYALQHRAVYRAAVLEN